MDRADEGQKERNLRTSDSSTYACLEGCIILGTESADAGGELETELESEG
jgi:hypothetical protein